MARFVYGAIAGLLALVLQGVVVVMFPLYADLSGPIYDLFVLQVLAAMSFALFTSSVMPPHYRRGRAWSFLMAFAAAFFLPVAGQAWFLSLLLVDVLFIRRSRRADVALIKPPQFVSELVARVTYGFGARLRPRLRNPRTGIEDRLAAMVAMRSMPAHVTGGLLQELLTDSAEEIRLLAYGIADGAENEIMQRIHAAESQLSTVTDREERAILYACMAELHWEQVYQNLVRGEVREHALVQIEDYALRSLEHRPEQAGMWFLLGRCALVRGDAGRTGQCLEQAAQAGFPPCRLLPLEAEAAFQQRDFAGVIRRMDALRAKAVPPALAPALRYWV